MVHINPPKIKSGKATGIGFLILALICGLAAAGLVLFAGMQLKPSTPVFVVTEPIAIGDPFTPQNTKLVKMPPAGLPGDAISDAKYLATGVSTRTMYPGDLVRQCAIVDVNDKAGTFGLFPARLAGLKDRTLRAVEVPIDMSPGLLFGLRPGDKVDIVATYAAQEGQDKQVMARTVVEGAPVVGVRAPGEDEGGGNGALIVALSQKQNEALAAAREMGKVYVSAVPMGLQ